MAGCIAETGRLLGAHCSSAGGVSHAPAIGAEIGCTAIQLFTASNRQWGARPIPDDEAMRFRDAMARGGIRLAFAHATYLINLASPDAATFATSVTAMAEELTRADCLGLPFVVIHPGSPKERGAAWGIARAAEAIDRVYGIIPEAKARIALETTAGQGSSLGRTFEEIAAIIDAVRAPARVCACFDTCHAFAAGYDLRSEEGAAKMWRAFDRAIGFKQLAAIHLNDSKGELGSRIDRHTHIGKGKIGLAGFRHLMNDRRLAKIPMVLETPKGETGDRLDLMNLRQLLKLIRR